MSDKGYAGRQFTSAVRGLGATHVRPNRKDEPGQGLHLAPIRQRIESIFWTCKDILTLERHGARTLPVSRSAYCNAFCAWPPASASTTDWAVPAGLSLITVSGVESII